MRTARLQLRPLDAGELDDLVELDGFAVVREAVDPFGELIPGDMAERRDYERRLVGREDFLAAVELATGRFLGWFQAERVGDARSEVELGYRLRPDAWGQGFATEGAEALLGAALKGSDVQRVYAHALLSNPASIRVMERIGMRYVAPWEYRGLPGVEYEARRPPARGRKPPVEYEARRAPAREPTRGQPRAHDPARAPRVSRVVAALPGRSARGERRAAAPRAPREGRKAGDVARRHLARAAGARRGTQGAAVRVGRRRVGVAGRPSALSRPRSDTRQQLACARAALERGKGHGQVDGVPDGAQPRREGRPAVRSGGEHVFVTLGRGPDGSGGVQAFLHRPAVVGPRTPTRFHGWRSETFQ